MALLRVFQGGLPIAEVDVPAAGLSIGDRPDDLVRLSTVGVRARDEEGGRVLARRGGWVLVRRTTPPVEEPIEPGRGVAVGDATVDVEGVAGEVVLDVATLAPDDAAPPTTSAPVAQRYQALADVVTALGSEEADAFSDALGRALALAGAQRGFAGALEADGRGLRVVASVGLDGSDPRRQVSRSVVETVLREGREVVTGDASREVPTKSVMLLGLRTICAAPVRARGKVAGVVYADAAVRSAEASPGAVLGFLRVLAAALGRRLEDEQRRREDAETARAASSSSGRGAAAPDDDEAVWASPAMARLREDAQAAARALESRALPLLLTGETGSGKEVLARWLHARAGGGRGRFVAVNCAAIPRDLAESELFGIEQGVATGVLRRLGRFQQADGGTLFLDEVGEMDMAIQGKVLRTIETRRIQRVGGRDEVAVDVRIVSATNRPLGDAIRAGKFREDLYWRLCGLEMRVPPLRERPEDVPVLAASFLRRFAREYGSLVDAISPEAMARLAAHAWPGNVRELRQRIGALVALARGRTIEAADVERNLGRARAGDEAAPADPALRSMEDVEREHVERVLRRVGGDAGRAAGVLGIHRKTLQRWLRAKKDGGT